MPKLFVDDEDRRLLVDLEVGTSLDVGRSPAADLTLLTERASRRHCRLEARGEDHVLLDLGSTNGTTVAGAPLLREHVLADGDEIGVGAARLVYRREAR